MLIEISDSILLHNLVNQALDILAASTALFCFPILLFSSYLVRYVSLS